jgi:hypothetical protein
VCSAVGASLIAPELCVHPVGIGGSVRAPSGDVAALARVATWAVRVKFAVALFNLVGVQLAGHLMVVIVMYLYLFHIQSGGQNLLLPCILYLNTSGSCPAKP